jgi:hypothetical protein
MAKENYKPSNSKPEEVGYFFRAENDLLGAWPGSSTIGEYLGNVPPVIWGQYWMNTDSLEGLVRDQDMGALDLGIFKNNVVLLTIGSHKYSSDAFDLTNYLGEKFKDQGLITIAASVPSSEHLDTNARAIHDYESVAKEKGWKGILASVGGRTARDFGMDSSRSEQWLISQGKVVATPYEFSKEKGTMDENGERILWADRIGISLEEELKKLQKNGK